MKKIHLIVQKKDVVSDLEALRSLGVLHVEHQENLSGYQLTERREEVRILSQVVDVLKEIVMDVKQEQQDDWREIVNETLELLSEIERYTESIIQRQVQINKWEFWGDFDPKDIEWLTQRGIYIALCEISVSEKSKMPQGVVVETIYTAGGVARCLLLSREKKKLPFEVILPPPTSLTQMKFLQEAERIKIEKAKVKIQDNARYLKFLETNLVEAKNVLMFEEVEQGMKENENLSILKGYCPKNLCQSLEKEAKEKKWGLLMEEPSEEDQVPTLLKNPKWVELIKPVFNMLDIMPGYREKDISLFFLIFFSMFFGILVGDTGYGVIYLLLTLLAQVKFKDKLKDQSLFVLLFVFCGCAITWGILTGTYFGQAWLPSTVKPLLPWLADSQNVQTLCFLIGAIHLSIAHIWKAILKWPALSFLSEVGWLCILWVMFFLAQKLVLGLEFPGFAKILLYIGIGLIIMFTRPSKNPLKAIGPGLGDLALNLINTFTDIVSYIRLFAVGLATVAIADAFNTMALSIGFNNILTGLMTSLILFIGHAFNMILATMGILVHGLRLNVLEFSGHLSLEWAGFKYQPFQKINKT